MTWYAADLGFDVLIIVGDFSQAAAPVYYEGPDGDLVHTGRQVADFAHCPEQAALDVADSWGPDYLGDADSAAELLVRFAAIQ